MYLVRFGNPNFEKTGVQLDDGRRVDVSLFGEDYNPHFFSTNGILRLEKWVSHHIDKCPLIGYDERLGSPLCSPSKIVCVGKNYSQHALEMGSDVPKYPMIFFKSTSAIVGSDDDLILPKQGNKTDWEVELAVVIGQEAYHVNLENAMDYIAGYTLFNDISERAFQLEHGGQYVKGKSSNTFAPIGPYLAPKKNIKNPNQLSLWLKLNGQIMQQSNTSKMIYNIPYLISHISQFMTLCPGDIISTGTPSGVGAGQSPPRFLKGGDLLEYGIESLGEARKKVVTS